VQEHCDKPWWVSWEIIGKPLENGGFNIFNGNTIGKPWENGGFNIFNGKTIGKPLENGGLPSG
jgi:hypothetical protein